MNNTLFIGQHVVELAQTDSTNNYLKQMLANGRPIEGIAVVAELQSAGRGQQGNIWHSEPGMNLTLSYLLYPDFLNATEQFYLSMVVSLAVKDCCEALLNDEVKIKWPNDIYYLNGKISGILIETTISGTGLSSAVIGIGLNVNQTVFDTSLRNPTSLKLITGKPFELKSVLSTLNASLEKYYLQLRQRHFNFLEKAYTTALYRYQQTYEFRKGERIIRGEINGVSKEGRLILHSDGKVQRYNFKELEYII